MYRAFCQHAESNTVTVQYNNKTFNVHKVDLSQENVRHD